MEIKKIYNLYSKYFLVDTDTRDIRKNTLFFALKGDNFNGNKFASEAIKNGAAYAIIDEEEFKTSDKTILVENVLETLQELAKYHRLQLKTPIIALTGSNGKTTTKELINCILSKKYKTTATLGNLNNHIGVPLTLLSMTPKTEIGIVEMGANHQKEIEFLCSIALPDFGYVTNFGKAHLEGFGSIEGVIEGKSELYRFLNKNSKIAFINPNDAIQVKKTRSTKIVSFLEDIAFLEANPFVNLSYNSVQIKSNLIGEYNYTNIVAAITIGNYFKVDYLKIKKAIENYVPTNNRSQIIVKESNHIILDAYNANPSSMKVALENFSKIKETFKTVILGDMFELGAESDKEHQEIVNLADSFSFSNTLYVGANFYKTNTKNHTFKTFEELKCYINKKPLENQYVLIKGSRGMKLERILNVIY
ncbi:UDP-N-acetylmuramoyl-tripeptide--D-alanyl-D-alanine ligase [Polaribacter sp. ALD11]|uniref:UDP-N-acetylmuramoyl-tripeptide--D-alanyl-D- alanine ligase n=1 Tax=Polaribacter sp. ALD11 TaxID=2058137 RepID=UPI000C2FFBBA|nr:UDP-N-acetylmuramoyl-tripeptide--D-alanyl-D-alanine ligase [Polaribacter sp. ALD11]AUC85222.1 UDP-N-acetylmuramoyl-tripeptide--D-alanyl-D-alanine ligase [Polaribacter sp. ALD11]